MTIIGNEKQSILIIGNDNIIQIDDNVRLEQVQFFISGNQNRIHISQNCSGVFVQFHIEQNENAIVIENGTTFHGREGRPIQFALDEKTNLHIAEDCMLSNNIQIRTTDSHSIVDRSGKRLNHAKDIYIGKHCWIGLNCLLLKGTMIKENTIVAAGSVCTMEYQECHVILGGNPAKVIKRNVDWDRKFV